MKVRFANGNEVAISPVSSQYCITIPTTDATAVSEFEANLTSENLSNFQLIDETDNNKVTASGKNFVYAGIIRDSAATTEVRNETNFSLRPMTAMEIKIAEMNEMLEVYAGAIEELAAMSV